MKLYTDVDQGTQAWRQLRLGIPTASQFYLLVDQNGKPKPPSNKERKRYMYRLAAERILGEVMPDRFEGNEWTERGSNLEEKAADKLAELVGCSLKVCGFIKEERDRWGCSPDRILADRNEGAEIKAPAPWTHVQYLCEGLGDRHPQQIQGQIMIAGFDAVHFWSYYPNAALPPVHIVVRPDDGFIAKLHRELERFSDEISVVEDFIRRNGGVERIIRAMQ